MNRDMDLVRLILQKVQSCQDPYGLLEEVEIEGHSDAEVSYHIKILNEAGFLEASDMGGLGNFKWFPGNLTWKGQDFLDATKDDALWKKAKETVIKPGVSFTFNLLFSWLEKKAGGMLGL